MQKHMQKLSKIFESVLFWLFLALLMFIPLFMKFPLFGVSGTFVAIRAEDIFIAFVFLVWFLYLVTSRKFKIILSDKLNQAVLLFFFVAAVSLFSAAFVTHTVSLNVGTLHLLRRVELILLMPLAISAVKTKRQFYIVLGVLSLVLFLVLTYGMGQKYLRFPVVSTSNSVLSRGDVYYLGPNDRLGSTFSGHYDLAVFLMMMLTLMSATFFYFVGKFEPKKVKNNLGYVIWISLLSILSIFILILTAARLSFVAVVFGISVAFVLVGRKKFVLLIVALAIAVMIYPSQLRDRFISTFTVNIQNSWTGFSSNNEFIEKRSELNIPTLPIADKERISSTQSGVPAPDIVPGEPTDTVDLGVYRSFNIRLNVEWPRAIRAFTKNPLLGTGYSSIGVATDNDILRSFGEVGLLGTWAFLLIIIEVFKRLWKIYKNKKGFIHYFTAGTIALMLAYIINSLFIDVFEASKVAALLWMIIGVNLAGGKFKNST